MPADFKSWFDIISQVLLLILGSMVFLQIRVAKNDLRVRSKRESTAVSTELANKFATELIPKISEFYLKLKDKNHTPEPIPFKNFYPEEYGGLDEKEEKLYNKGIDFFKANIDLSRDCAAILNSFEALAMNFTKGVADEEVVFTALSQVYCNFIEKSFPILCTSRGERKVNLYENTVALHKIWKKRLNSLKELSSQSESVSKRLDIIRSFTKIFTPIGVKK